MSNFIDLFNEDKSDIQLDHAKQRAKERSSGNHNHEKFSLNDKDDKRSTARRAQGSENNVRKKYISDMQNKRQTKALNDKEKVLSDRRNDKDAMKSAEKLHKSIREYEKKEHPSPFSKPKKSLYNKNESFHFGPTFDSDYFEYAVSEAEDNSYIEAAYDGHAIENDEDPTEPTVDDIVNAEPDLAANYHFGPAFGQDIFTKSTLKHSRK